MSRFCKFLLYLNREKVKALNYEKMSKMDEEMVKAIYDLIIKMQSIAVDPENKGTIKQILEAIHVIYKIISIEVQLIINNNSHTVLDIC